MSYFVHCCLKPDILKLLFLFDNWNSGTISSTGLFDTFLSQYGRRFLSQVCMEIFFEPHICIHNYADLEQTKSKVEKAHYVWPYFWVANKTGANKGRSNNAQYMFFMRSFSSYHWLTVGALHQVWLNISWHYLLWFNTSRNTKLSCSQQERMISADLCHSLGKLMSSV